MIQLQKVIEEFVMNVDIQKISHLKDMIMNGKKKELNMLKYVRHVDIKMNPQDILLRDGQVKVQLMLDINVVMIIVQFSKNIHLING